VNYKFIKILKKNIPTPIKSVLKRLGIEKLIDKRSVELAFQVEWTKDFKDNKIKVLEYWMKYRYLNKINKICNIQNNHKVLDVGCGISTILHFIKGERYGIDPLADEYQKIYKYPGEINVQKGFSENLPFVDEYFDYVFCSNALDHVLHPSRALDEIRRTLKPNGYFVLTIEIFEEEVHRDPAHPHSVTKKRINELLGENFIIVLEEYSPWIGMRAYVNGSTESRNNECIMVLMKAKSRSNDSVG